MKLIFLLLFTFTSVWAKAPRARFIAQESPCDRQKLLMKVGGKEISIQDLLQKTVSLGASVSAGYGESKEPLVPAAERLVKRFKAPAVQNLTWPHHSSIDILKKYADVDLSQSTLIIALDLFFWDSQLDHNPECKVDHIKKSLKILAAGPLIVGNFPVKGSSFECIQKVNQEIEEFCTSANNCRLLDQNELFSHLNSEEAKNYFQKDKLHMTNFGYRFVEDQICANLFDQ